jgi:cellulose synthase/poly-beta-1,6-N-acetylglucosamine synthase-like glycosyltransferase
MFDADFVPGSDFIRRQIHHFTDPKIGFVQARWGHINENQSLLTKLQALFLDGHFVLEHTGRHRSGRFFTFSGTAGMWRKECISDSGGWQHDTLVEDCDLSYRAQLKGWRGTYLVDHVVPAELPVDMNAFKSQQHRWAKGFIQAMKKVLPTVWRSNQPLKIKIEATFHLCNNLSYPLMIILSVLLLPALYYRGHVLSGAWAVLFDLSLFIGATVSVMSFYVYAQRQIHRAWYKKLIYMPLLLAIGIGISLNQSKAVLEALFNQVSGFVRTPKYHADSAHHDASWTTKRYAVTKNTLPYLELFFAAYYVFVTGYVVWQKQWVALPFVALFLWGYGYVGILSVSQHRQRQLAAPTVSFEA